MVAVNSLLTFAVLGATLALQVGEKKELSCRNER